MELICNELSYYPLAGSNNEAERRFKQLFDTFKVANNIYGFKNIRFHSNNAEQLVTGDKNIFELIPFITNSNIKNSIFSFFRPPYADDLDEEELESFFKSEYKIVDENVPTDKNPVGLPIAHIKSIPTISFDSDSFWRRRKMNLTKTNTSETENIDFSVYNICLDTDLETQEIVEWSDKMMSGTVDSEEMLVKYLAFSKYTISFGASFLSQLFQWKDDDIKLFKYTLLLMKDVQLHPFTGGMGRTENLRHLGKEASKRITQGDRLSYMIENNIVTFIACKGHYKFH